MIDETHDPSLTSWVASANGHPDFPIQNLPFGVFSPPGGAPRGGVAIGDFILDIGAAGLPGKAAQAAEQATLNGFLAMGAGPRGELRRTLSALLATGAKPRPDLLHNAADCTMHLPCAIGDYTDFFVGIHHAVNGGKLFRPDNPLMPNYKYVPVAYHGRASSVRPSGDAIRRPNGQYLPQGASSPGFGPCQRLDFELELAVWIGPGNSLGEPIRVGQAADHIAGFCLLNDWSARDVQAWEYQPLGPFLAKNFSTTVSCWVITPEALAPFRIAQPPRPVGDPAPLPYLNDPADQAGGALNLDLEVTLLTAELREPQRISASNARYMYWTPAQMLAHHTSGGCDLRPGDLLGTGTISGPDDTSMGSLLEATYGGQRPITLANGAQRGFLQDGDQVTLHARAHREGFVSIGFGGCVGTVLPASPYSA